MHYLLVLRLEESKMFINKSLGVNETKVVLGSESGLENNQEYEYTISAINSVGMTTTDVKTLCRFYNHVYYYEHVHEYASMCYKN